MKYKTLLAMECMKLYARMNIVFTTAICTLVLLQVGFVVRLEIESISDPTAIYDFAARYIDNIAFTFIPILLLVNIGSEFDYAVVQRSLVSGISRRNYFVGKLMQLGIFAFIATLLALIFYLLAAVIYELPILLDFVRLGRYFIVSFCLGSLSMLIVFLVRRRSYALAIFIAYILLENIVVATIPAKLIWLPFQTCKRLLGEGGEIILVVAYSILFLGISYRVFSKSDLR